MNLKIFDSNEYSLNANISNGKITQWGYNIDTNIPIIEDSKINVFYNYYKPKQYERHNEILYCFNMLLKNDNIDNLYVLLSDDLEVDNDKLIKIRITNQPKFKDFFNIINFYVNDNDINIILNSDCYLDKDNIELIKKYINKDDAFLLSRWDILSFKPFKSEHFNTINKDDNGCSQDVWIFKGKTKQGLNGNFEMGRAGCDNAIAYEFDSAGYNVSNPSFTIKAYHYHLSGIRTYGDYVIGEIDNRDDYRVPPPYKMIPSTRFINENMKVVFYNNYHNGDIHYSKEFIKDIMKKYKAKNYSYYFDLEHVCDKNIIKDCNIKYESKIPENILQEEQLTINDDTIYINTWVGQKNKYFVDNIGINLKANYEIYKEIYKKLNIKLENIEHYIPNIDYGYFDIKKINHFLEGKEKYIKILISNGITRSGQCDNFDMNEIIDCISSLYKNVLFVLTDSKNRIDKNNIFYTDDIIDKKCDLNEISYLSTFCDIIIGRSSGPYAFTMTRDNLFNSKKTFICFCDKPEYEWYISTICKHITTNKYKKHDVVSLISAEIDEIIDNKDKKLVNRIAFTIILNGIHHLKHNNYAEFLSKNFNYWVVVEGAAKNNDSTSWCKKMPSIYHNNGKSIDGTIEYMKDLQKRYNNIIFIESDGMWNSKDEMVNRAIEEIKKITSSCFLWEIDIDEQWTSEQIIKSEIELKEKKAKSGKFNVFQFVGENLIAIGKDWAGEPFNRLWIWNGEKFKSHEPPILDCKYETVLLSEKMKHYSFYFDEDVKFKNDWYSDHDGLYENWIKLKKEIDFPKHITYLLPKFKNSNHLNNSDNLDSWIVKYNPYEKIEIKKRNVLNKFVDDTYVINLKRRSDRLEHMIDEFDKLNMSFTRFDAVDGRKLKIKENDLKKAQIACLRSHIGVIKDALSKGYNKISVFEDDVIFCDDFEERFKYFANNVPEDWEILFLGSNLNQSIYPTQVKNNIFKIINTYGCFAMILNNKNGLFQKIIEITKDEIKPIDNYFYDEILPTINSYVFIPFFVKTLFTESDISDNKNAFSYDCVDKLFKNRIKIPTIEKISVHPTKPSSQPQKIEYTRTRREMCEEYLYGMSNFLINYNNRVIFDSSSSDKINVNFFDTYFTIYGRPFSYQGMTIKLK